jgi:predicted glycoside hydrolase/deacetylase ChbG (UPF0249 family)
MSLIIHADDFGISESTTKAICEVIAKGWCHETSLMVNMPFADQAIELARKQGFANKVGIHLNLTEGMPLTDNIRRCPRICDSNGEFNCKFHRSAKTRFILSTVEERAIVEEIEAQLKKFVKYGGLMMRIDSHHHVHTDWVVYRHLKPLAKKYGFTSIRLSATLHPVRLPLGIYKVIYNFDLRRNFLTNQEFDGYNAGVIDAVARGLEVELMVHPRYDNGLLMDFRTPYGHLKEFLKANYD